MPSLNDTLNPYNAGAAISGAEPNTNAGGGQASFQLNNGFGGSVNLDQLGGIQKKYFQGLNPNLDLGKAEFDPTTGLSKGQYSLQLQRNNQVAGLGQIPNLNYGGTINGATDLNKMVQDRQGYADMTAQSLNQLEDQSGIHEQFTQGLQPNGLSRLALINRLSSTFGNGWHQNAQAKQILDQFDSVAKQNQDIGNLNQLMDQGKTALDFLSSQPTAVTFNLIQKLGDQVIGSTGVGRPFTDLAISDPNKFLGMFNADPSGVSDANKAALPGFVQGGTLG